MRSLRNFVLLLVFVIFVSTSLASDFKTINDKIKIDASHNLIIIIEIDAGEIEINQNSKSDVISVSGQINEKLDEVNYGYDERHNEFTLTLDRKKWLKSTTDENASELEIFLPDEVTIELSTEIKAGKIDFDFGGLKLYSFELRNFAGEVRVDFSTPNKTEMEFLEVDVKIGETKLHRLGNAKFSDATINGGIGDMYVDLQGIGAKDAKVDIDLDIGSTKLILPDNLGIKMRSTSMGFLSKTKIDSKFNKRGRYLFSRNYESVSKTIYVSIHTGIGELNVDLR